MWILRFRDGQKKNVPEEVWETIAMSEEELLEQYLENGSIPEQEIRRLIRQRKLFPCYFGSALKLKGVEELLNGLEMWYGRNKQRSGRRIWRKGL